jgi:hypothetical protein
MRSLHLWSFDRIFLDLSYRLYYPRLIADGRGLA